MVSALSRFRTPALAGGLAAAAGLALAAAMHLLGVVPAMIIATGLVYLPFVIWRPGLALALLLIPVVLFEGQSGNVSSVPRLYATVSALHTTPAEGLILVAALALLVRAYRVGIRPPWPLTWPLALLGVATVAGAVVGLSNHAQSGDVFITVRHLAYLVLMPWIVVNVWRDPETIRRGLAVAAALVIVKAVLGLVSLHGGSQVDPTTGAVTSLTYYEPTSNFLSMLYLLLVLAAGIRRVRLPVWVWLGTPLVFASLLLSFRRSFWIGLVLGLLLVTVLAPGAMGRVRLVLVAGIIGLGLSLSLATGVVKDLQLQGQLAQRAQSINPAQLSSNPEDRYRLDERRNVLAEITRHPVTGLGLNVPWTARYPVSLSNGDPNYVHFAALWFWLKLGILGLVAYLALMLSGIRAGYRAWNRCRDSLLQITGLALAVGLLSLMVVETTATFTGADPRFTIVLGAILGLLGSLWRLAGVRPRPPQP
jgi:O-antigen ligase